MHPKIPRINTKIPAYMSVLLITLLTGMGNEFIVVLNFATGDAGKIENI